MIETFLVVDKPPGLTSHDVVAVLRAVLGERQIGHTGTLDPFATGVLACAIGGTTKLLQFLDESIKVYDLTIALGAQTDTGDPTGEVVETRPVPAFDRARLDEVLAGFLGDRMQVPPAFSAVKHQGRPLYWYARRGEPVTVPARPIKVHEIRVVEVGPERLRLVATCSKGTYARVLAEEIAAALGTVGHLAALSRLQSGPFLLEDAVSMAELAAIVSGDPSLPWERVLRAHRDEERIPWRPRDEVRAKVLARALPPIRALASLPILDVPEVEARRVQHGNPPRGLPGAVRPGDRFLVVCGADLLAVAEVGPRGTRLLRVLGAEEPPRDRRGGRDDRGPRRGRGDASGRPREGPRSPPSGANEAG